MKTLDDLTNVFNKVSSLDSTLRDKMLGLDGYEEVDLVEYIDGDTYKARRSDGSTYNVRLGRGKDEPYVDTVEKSRTLYDGDDITTDPYKANQVYDVAKAYGISTNEVTNQQFNNYNKFTVEQANRLQQGLHVEEFDSTKAYGTIDLSNNPLKVKMKVNGIDANGRLVADFVNSDDTMLYDKMVGDYALNTGLKVRSDVNQAVAITPESSYAGNMVDVAQASTYSMLARVSDVVLPEAAVNYIDEVTKAKGLPTLTELAYNPEVANSVAGVNYKNSVKFNNDMAESEALWESGEYVKSILAAMPSAGTLIAQSTPQMAVLAAGGLASKGSAIPAIMSSFVIGADTAANIAEEYKANNGGKEMPKDQFMAALIIQAGLSRLDLGILKSVTGSLVKNTVLAKATTKALTGMEKNFFFNAGKALTVGVGGEAIQGGLESVNEQYFTQHADDRRGVFEIAASSETGFNAMLEALAGGTMTSGGVTLSGVAQLTNKSGSKIKAKVKTKVSNKVTEGFNQIRNTQETKKGNSAYSKKHSTDVMDLVTRKESEIDYKDTKSVAKTLRGISKIFDTPNLTGEANDFLKTRYKEIYKKAKAEGIDLSKEEGFEPVAISLALNSLKQKGKKLKDLTAKEAEEFDQEMADLGVSEETRRKTFDMVDLEARYGDRGIYGYVRKLDAVSEQLNTKETFDGRPLTDRDITKLNESAKESLKGLTRLQKAQETKLTNLVNDAVKLLKFDRPTYESKYSEEEGNKGFVIYASDVLNTSPDNRTAGIRKVMNRLAEDLSIIQSEGAKYGIKSSVDTTALSKQLSDAISEYTNEKSKSKKTPQESTPTKSESVDKTKSRDTKHYKAIAELIKKGSDENTIYEDATLEELTSLKTRLENVELKGQQQTILSIVNSSIENLSEKIEDSPELSLNDEVAVLEETAEVPVDSTQQVEETSSEVVQEPISKEPSKQSVEFSSNTVQTMNTVVAQENKNISDKLATTDNWVIEEPVVVVTKEELLVRKKEAALFEETKKAKSKIEAVVYNTISTIAKKGAPTSEDIKTFGKTLSNLKGKFDRSIIFESLVKAIDSTDLADDPTLINTILFELLGPGYTYTSLKGTNTTTILKKKLDKARANLSSESESEVTIRKELNEAEHTRVQLKETLAVMSENIRADKQGKTFITKQQQIVADKKAKLKDLISLARKENTRSIKGKVERREASIKKLYPSYANKTGAVFYNRANVIAKVNQAIAQINEQLQGDLDQEKLIGLKSELKALTKVLQLHTEAQDLSMIYYRNNQFIESASLLSKNLNLFEDTQNVLKATELQIANLKSRLKAVSDTDIPAVASSAILDNANKSFIQGIRDNAKIAFRQVAINPLTTFRPATRVKSLLAVAKLPSSTIRLKDGKTLNSSLKVNKATQMASTIDKSTGKLTFNMGLFEKNLIDNPAMALIYDLTSSTEAKINHNVTTAIYKVAVNTAVNEAFNFNPDWSMLDAFQMYNDDGSAMTQSQKAVYLSRYGVPYSVIANKIGRSIADELGLLPATYDDTIDGAYSRMVASLGTVGMLVLEYEGLVVNNVLTQTISDKTSTRTVDVNTVKLQTKEVDENGINYKEMLQTLEEKFSIERSQDFTNKPSRTPLREVTYQEATLKKDAGTNLTQEQVKAVNNLNKVQWFLHNDIIEKLIPYKDRLRHLFDYGFEEDLAELTLDEFISITGTSDRTKGVREIGTYNTGTNGAIDKEINTLFEAYEEDLEYINTGMQPGPRFFNHTVATTGRFNMQSSTLNPQVRKKLHRQMLTNSAPMEVDFSQENAMRPLYFAIAAAFDNVGSNADIDNFGKTFFEKVDPDRLFDALLNDEGKSKTKLKAYSEEVGIPLSKFAGEFGLTLLAIDTLQKYKEYQADPSKGFSHRMVTESDASTQGYALRALQYITDINDETLLGILEKVGIVIMKNDHTEVRTMNDLKADPNFTDIYQAVVKGYKLVLPVSKTENWQEGQYILNEELITNSAGNKFAAQIIDKLTRDLMESTLMQGVLLEGVADGEKVSSDQRKKAKPVATYVGYGAGANTTAWTSGSEALYADYFEYIATARAIMKSVNSSGKDKIPMPELTTKQQQFAKFITPLIVMHPDFKINYKGPFKSLSKDEQAKVLNELKFQAMQFILEKSTTNTLDSLFIETPGMMLETKKGAKPWEASGKPTFELESIYEWKGDTSSKKSAIRKSRINLAELMISAYAKSEAKGLVDSVQSMFGSEQKYNKIFNTAYGAIGQVYVQVVDSMVEKVKEKNGGYILHGEKQAILDKFRLIMPAINTALNTSNLVEEALPILDRVQESFTSWVWDTKNGKRYKKPVVGRVKHNNDFNSKVVRKQGDRGKFAMGVSTQDTKYIPSGSKAVVIATQSTDSAVLARTVNRLIAMGIPVLPIHDAIQVPTEYSAIATQIFNEETINVAREFNQYGQLVELLDQLIVLMDEDPEIAAIVDNVDVAASDNYSKHLFKMGIDSKGEPIEPIYTEVRQANNALAVGKKALKDSIVGCANVQSSEGSQAIVMPTSSPTKSEFANTELEKEQAFKEQSGLGSSAEAVGELIVEQLKRTAFTSKESAIELLNYVSGLDSRESESHLKELTELISSFNFSLINEVKVEVGTIEEDIALGEYNPAMPDTDILVGVPVASNLLSNIASNAEVMAHEMVHTFVAPILLTPETFKAKSVATKIRYIYNVVAKHSDYTIFLKDPDTATEKEVEIAQRMWTHVFQNEETGQNVGLNEFIAYGLTNEAFAKNIDKIDILRKKYKGTLADRIVQFGTELLEVFRGQNSLSEVFPNFANILMGRTSFKTKGLKTAYKNVVALMKELDVIADKNAEKLNKTEYRALERLFKLIQDTLGVMNKFGSTLINGAITLSDRFKINLDIPEPDAPRMDFVKYIAKVLLNLLTSAEARAAFPGIMSMWGVKQYGTIMTIFRDASPNTPVEDLFEAIADQARIVEQLATGEESAIFTGLSEAFGGNENMTVSQKASTKSIGLETNLNELLDHNSIEEIIELVKSDEALSSEISKVSTELNSRINESNKRNLVNGYITLLANFMVTQEGTPATLFNGTQIATFSKVDESLVPTIDRLVTLKALELSSKADRNLFSGLAPKGIETLLKSHKRLREDSYEFGNLTKATETLGYTKPILNNKMKTKIASLLEADRLAHEGYVLVSELPYGQGLYRSSHKVQETRDGSMFITTGAYAPSSYMGAYNASNVSRRIQQIKDKDGNITDLEVALNKEAGVIASEARETRAEILKILASTDDFKMDDLAEFESTGLVPLITMKGEDKFKVDFSLVIPRNIREEYTDLETSGLVTLSKMANSQVLWSKGQEHNIIAYNEIQAHSRANMHVGELQQAMDRSSTEFVWVSRESTDEYIAEAFNVLPRQIRERIENTEENLYVPQALINTIFGVPSSSINDTKIGKKVFPIAMKKFNTFIGLLMQEIASFVKQNIVVRMPKVVIDNILQNIGLSIAFGLNPITVMKYTLQSFRNTKEFVANRREYNNLIMKAKIGMATDAEVGKLQLLKEALENNPVYPLIQAGLYQSVTEDLKETETQLLSRGSQFIDSKIGKYVPSVAKGAAKNLFMLEGTPAYNFMFEIVEYSDFSARAAHYQITMDAYKKAKAKSPEKYTDTVEQFSKKTINDIRTMFVNYNKPNSRFEQWLDDLGLMMFIKYAKRVNAVIIRLFKERPVHALLAIFFQSYMLDMDTIYDSAFINRDITNNMRYPWENFMSAITPIPVQLALGR